MAARFGAKIVPFGAVGEDDLGQVVFIMKGFNFGSCKLSSRVSYCIVDIGQGRSTVHCVGSIFATIFYQLFEKVAVFPLS